MNHPERRHDSPRTTSTVVSLESARARRAAALLRLRARYDVSTREVESAWTQGATHAGVELTAAMPPGLAVVSVSGPDSDGLVMVSVARALTDGYVALCHRALRPGASSPGLCELVDGASHLLVRIDVPGASFGPRDVARWLALDDDARAHALQLDLPAFESALGITRDGDLAVRDTAALVRDGECGRSELPIESATLDLMTMVVAHRAAVDAPSDLHHADRTTLRLCR